MSVDELVRNVYVQFECSDPEWDATVTEHTDIQLMF